MENRRLDGLKNASFLRVAIDGAEKKQSRKMTISYFLERKSQSINQ